MPHRPDYRDEQRKLLNQPPKELSDEEVFGSPEMSDDDVFGVAGDASIAPPPRLRTNPKTGQDERSAAQALNVLDLGLGVGDEAVGGLSYLGTLLTTGDTDKASKAYKDEKAYADDLKKRWSQQPDWTPGDYASYAGQFVAGAPLFAKVFRGGQIASRAFTAGKPAATILGRGAQNAAALAGTGAAAVEGHIFGSAEGDLSERAQAVMDAGGGPALLGAGLGVAAGGLGSGVSRIAQRGVQALRTPEAKGARYIAEKLLQSGQTPEELAAAYAAAARTGKPVALGDVGPQGVRDAGAAAARTPGPGREAAQETILPRQEGQAGRVSDDVAQAVGGEPGSFTQTVDDLIAQRAAEAKPLYAKALGSNTPVVSPKIVEITGRPSGKAAMQRGLKIAQDEGIPLEELEIRDAAGNVVGYSAKALHYMKMGLDDMIESATRSGDNSAARAYSIMKKELLGEMDSRIPGYRQARENFAGHSASKRALEQGRAAHNAHPDQIKAEMAGMTEGEREMYRRGFAQRVIEEVERSPDAGNAARRIFGNTVKRERMRAVLGDEQYNELAKRLGVEDQMYQTFKRTNVGSETAERIAGQTDIDDFVVGQSPALAQGFAQSFMSGTIGPLLRQIGMGGLASLLRGVSQRARGQIAKMLFSTNPAEVKQALSMIAKEYNNAKNFQAAQDALIAESAANEKTQAGAGVVVGTAAETAGGLSPF